jgi:uncharacterized protein (DUF2147 family)
MMRKNAAGFRLAACCVAACLATAKSASSQEKQVAAVDPMSPVGIWTTVDDSTGKPKSLIRISERNGELFGSIVGLIDPPGGNTNPLCDKCSGSLQNRPVVGMTIMRGLRRDGDEWNGGTILDPESGSTYKVYLEVLEGGKKLKVRGYIGIYLIGRTQYWWRAR